MLTQGLAACLQLLHARLGGAQSTDTCTRIHTSTRTSTRASLGISAGICSWPQILHIVPAIHFVQLALHSAQQGAGQLLPAVLVQQLLGNGRQIGASVMRQ